MKIDFNEAAQILKNCEDAYILIHQSPDGDCTGSGTALYHILEYMGKRARVICSDEIPKRYAFMRTEYRDEEFEPKFIIASDVADIKLLGKYKEIYGDKVDLCIDHHISNTGYAKKTLVCPDASAACEVVYELIKILDIPLTEEITRCIYTGIATDTGCFKYENTTARCHEIVAELKRNCPVNFAKINRDMFDVKSRGRLKIERAVTDIMEYYLDDKCTMICITSDILNEMGVESAELEGMAGIPLQVEGVEVGVTIKQKDENSYKISMRSANDVNVSDICASLGGGGHIKAAGCLLHGTLDEVKKKIVAAVAEGLKTC
ncbi:DHH family phosphoesterase [Porcipelethomonas sp.]|uniref:DHH family phosphoesterase n=1 Tax=Porcipelethomonas sp. TaxID=2981675 RepID=UPI003EF8B886